MLEILPSTCWLVYNDDNLTGVVPITLLFEHNSFVLGCYIYSEN
jgi:hypothetical protein